MDSRLLKPSGRGRKPRNPGTLHGNMMGQPDLHSLHASMAGMAGFPAAAAAAADTVASVVVDDAITIVGTR